MKRAKLTAIAVVVLVGGCGDGGGGSSGPTDPTVAVASVEIQGASPTLKAGHTAQLKAVARDAQGGVLSGQSVAWSTSDSTRVRVTVHGTATAISEGEATISAKVAGATANVVIKVPRPLTWVEVEAGTSFSCGRVQSGTVYCWGSHALGQLGDGSARTLEPRPSPVRVSLPDPATSLSVGGGHACARMANGTTHCWGMNDFGQMGIGATPMCASWGSCSERPLPVAGGLSFASLTAGTQNTCGLTAAGEAFCWGYSGMGQLGIGTDVTPDVCQINEVQAPCSAGPRPVAGGLRLAVLDGRGDTVCGLTADGQAYCWGRNNTGQLGTGTVTGPESCRGGGGTACSTRPVAAAGALRFASIATPLVRRVSIHLPPPAGACGVAADGSTHCWGFVGRDFGPQPVRLGDHRFAQLSLGGDFGCGVTAEGEARCWGGSEHGQLGRGASTASPTEPAPVIGGLKFRSISAGFAHVCAVTLDGHPYCWGQARSGQLGTGDLSDSPRPVRVREP